VGVAALWGLLALLASPHTPWSPAPLLLLVALLSRWEPRLLRLGVVALWAAAGPEAGWPFLVGALVLGALRWSRVGTGLVVLALLLAARQGFAARELPAALEVVPGLVVVLVYAACGWSAASPARRPGPLPELPWLGTAALAAAGGILLLRVALAVGAPDALEAARRVHAVGLLHARLNEDPGARLALVAADPDRDEAAEAWLAGDARRSPDTLLAVGWRPQRPSIDPVDLARRLEQRGRGGEALRLLRRYPREGAVDWWRALLERTQGEAVGWRGGVASEVARLPGRLSLDLRWDRNDYLALPVHLGAEVDRFVLEGGGTAYRGAPSIEVKVDAGPVRQWSLDGPSRLELPGPHAAGPHRIELRFASDRLGPDGDRNVWIDALLTSP